MLAPPNCQQLSGPLPQPRNLLFPHVTEQIRHRKAAFHRASLAENEHKRQPDPGKRSSSCAVNCCYQPFHSKPVREAF